MNTPEIPIQYLTNDQNFYDQSPFREIETALMRYLKEPGHEEELRSIVRTSWSQSFKMTNRGRLQQLVGLTPRRLEMMIETAFAGFGYSRLDFGRYITEQREGYNLNGTPMEPAVLNHLIPTLDFWTRERRALEKAAKQADINSVLPPEIADVESNKESRPLIQTRGQKALGRQSWR